MEEWKIIHFLQAHILEVIENCKSGHPGAALSLVPCMLMVYEHLTFDSQDDKYLNRDIFVLSNGHACLLQYVFLVLTREHYQKENTSDVFNQLYTFRKVKSQFPGHPESHCHGVEATTGPLGQGIANAVGMALSIKKFIQRCKDFQKKSLSSSKNDFKIPKQSIVYSPVVFCMFGDGCYQEGISKESFSFASRYELNNIIYFYDSNEITIDGSTLLSMNEDQISIFRAFNLDTIEVDGWDIKEIDQIIKEKKKQILTSYDENIQFYSEKYLFNSKKSLIIILKTPIAKGTICEGSSKSHGSPLGRKAVDEFKKKYNVDLSNEAQKQLVLDYFKNLVARKTEEVNEWKSKFLSKIEVILKPEIKISKNDFLNSKSHTKDDTQIISTRELMNQALFDYKPVTDLILAGSADLTPSCLIKTNLSKPIIELTENEAKKPIVNVNLSGDYIYYGIREHSMFAIANGISLHGIYVPLTSTFLNFITYGYPAVRLSAISNAHNLFIMTHDSIGQGEDGPTHQPIETLALLRACPNITVFRPSNKTEVKYSLYCSMKNKKTNVIVLSRQKFQCFDYENHLKCQKGAYVIHTNKTDVKTPNHITILATGSEVSLAIQASNLMTDNVVKVTSMLSWEIFEEQDEEYKKEILSGFIISLEALSTFGWQKYTKHNIGIDTFGLSGEGQQVMDYFGFSKEKVAEKITNLYNRYTK